MKQVEIYTKDYCPYCRRAKELFNIKGIPYQEYEISQDPERTLEMQQRAEGRTTVPEIFINGELIGGCDELFHLDEEGKLDSLLS